MVESASIGEMVNGTAVTRRRVLRWALGAGVAVLGGAATRGVSASGGSEYFHVSVALNLRAKPMATGKILLVIPADSLVKNLASSSNGYNKVSYQGTTGWAYGAYLEETNGGSDNPDVTWLGTARVTTDVNLRTGPSTGNSVIQVLKKGTTIQVSDWVLDGYRYVDRDGHGNTGWVFDDYIGQVETQGPISFITTTAVNLRAQPSTSAKIIKVVPKGTTVTDYDLVLSGGFRGVDVNGTVGWISDTYLTQI